MRWLKDNEFTGPLPDLSKLKQLETLELWPNNFLGCAGEFQRSPTGPSAHRKTPCICSHWQRGGRGRNVESRCTRSSTLSCSPVLERGKETPAPIPIQGKNKPQYELVKTEWETGCGGTGSPTMEPTDFPTKPVFSNGRTG